MMWSHHVQVTKTNQLAFTDDIRQYLLFTAFPKSTGPNKQHDGPKTTDEISDHIRNILFIPFLNGRFIETELQLARSRHL